MANDKNNQDKTKEDNGALRYITAKEGVQMDLTHVLLVLEKLDLGNGIIIPLPVAKLLP